MGELPHGGRAKTLEAARDAFAERGYHAASVADIAARAGVAKSVLYHHFGSKVGLYEAVLRAEIDELLRRVRAALPPPSAPVRLRPALEVYLDFLVERPATWRLLMREAPADPEALRIHEALHEERSSAMGALLEREGPHDKRLLQGLISTAVRAFSSWWYDHQDVPRDAILEAIMAFAEAAAHRIAPGDRSAAPRSPAGRPDST